MSKRPRDNRPYIRPVTKLELSEANIKLRWIAIAVCLAVAAVAIGYGFHAALSTEPGWQQVTPLSEEVSCASEFVLMYDFGVGDINPTAAHKKLEAVYGDLTVSAYRLFSPDAQGEDNLQYLNAHVNETVTVAPALYDALEQIDAAGSRYPFLAPVQGLYDAVYLSATDAEAALYDPMKNEELARHAREMAAVCADPAMIRLEILGENQVKLVASPEYLAFAAENEITVFLDFGWMTNAFIIDYMADALEEAGFDAGYLSSYDGFTRNLYGRGKGFSQNVYHRVGNDVYMPAVLEYAGPMSIVTLRNFPLSDQERWMYYAYQDGTVTSVYLDPQDGSSRTSIDGLTAYSREKGCAEILLKTTPVFIAENFDAYALEMLAHDGIESIRCHEKGIVCTEVAQPCRILDPSYTLMYSNVQ